jgi:hypothetical protein
MGRSKLGIKGSGVTPTFFALRGQIRVALPLRSDPLSDVPSMATGSLQSLPG